MGHVGQFKLTECKRYIFAVEAKSDKPAKFHVCPWEVEPRGMAGRWTPVILQTKWEKHTVDFTAPRNMTAMLAINLFTPERTYETVYRAENPELNREVVVKALKSSKPVDASARSRFEQEIKALGRLRHENIVQALDAGIEAETPFIAMEWLEGCDLAQYVKQYGLMATEKALVVVRQAAFGLEHAHQAGLVHRDVKPSNLFLLHDGTVKLLDLGIAKPVVAEGHDKQTKTGHVVGSPDFMAPEQFRGAMVDARSDIYSLGCTLAYLTTGK